MTYHYVPDGAEEAGCVLAGTGTRAPEDELVPASEVERDGGRWINCTPCLTTLGGMKHVAPPAGWDAERVISNG